MAGSIDYFDREEQRYQLRYRLVLLLWIGDDDVLAIRVLLRFLELD